MPAASTSIINGARPARKNKPEEIMSDPLSTNTVSSQPEYKSGRILYPIALDYDAQTAAGFVRVQTADKGMLLGETRRDSVGLSPICLVCGGLRRD
jgi:hypothetical protein